MRQMSYCGRQKERCVVRDSVFTYTPDQPRASVWESALGIEGTSGLARMSQAQNGIPVASFDRFAEAIDVSREALAQTLHVSLRTVQRRREAGARLGPGASERVVRLADLYAHASKVIGDDDLARQWMQTPRDVFGGKTPFEMAGSELGAQEVDSLLHRVEHGVFY